MDFTLKTKMVVDRMTVKMKVKESVVIRRLWFRLTAELEADTARAIGSDAVTAHDGIIEGGMSKVVMPLDALQAKAHFEGDERQVEIAAVHGLQAVMTRAAEGPGTPASKAAEAQADEEASAEDLGDETPTTTAQLALDFECPLLGNENALLFLAKATGTVVEVSFTPAQTELALPLTTPAPGKKGKGKKGADEPLAF